MADMTNEQAAAVAERLEIMARRPWNRRSDLSEEGAATIRQLLAENATLAGRVAELEATWAPGTVIGGDLMERTLTVRFERWESNAPLQIGAQVRVAKGEG